MKSDFDYSSRSFRVELNRSGSQYRASSGNRSATVELLHQEAGRLDLLINDGHVVAYVSSDGAKRWVSIDGQTILLARSGAMRRAPTAAGPTPSLTAPMPGLVRVVNVRVGETVAAGQTLLVLEAMKMEFRIQAPGDGRVKALHVQQGQTVDREQVLIELEEVR